MLSRSVRPFLFVLIYLLLVYPFAGSQVTAQLQAPPPVHRAGGGFTQPDPIDFNDHEGWTQIFDGKTLNGWDGSPEVWHVEDGSLVGESSPEHPSGTTNIIWRGGEPANFELKAEMKLEGADTLQGRRALKEEVSSKPKRGHSERRRRCHGIGRA